MSKTIQEAQGFFKKSVQSDIGITEGFGFNNLIKTPTIAIPITIELTEKEKLNIQKLLVDEYRPGAVSEDKVSQHVEQLTNITKQIKSISAQSVLLHGERIKQAHDLLADYREGAFTKWLMSTYGNRQTPYSMLRYYEFYHSAPHSARAMIESAPKKAVYLLASCEGDKKKKLDLIIEHGKESQSDLLLLIQSTFPRSKATKRKSSNESTIETIDKLCCKLESNSNYLSDNDRENIEKIIERLQKLCL